MTLRRSVPSSLCALEPMEFRIRLDSVSMRESARAAASAVSALTEKVRYRWRRILETPSLILSLRMLKTKGVRSAGSHDTQVADGTIRYHKVKSGDTLSRIAKVRGVSVSTLCKLNRIKPIKR